MALLCPRSLKNIYLGDINPQLECCHIRQPRTFLHHIGQTHALPTPKKPTRSMKPTLANVLTLAIAFVIAYGALTPPGAYNLTTGPASLFDKQQHITAFALLVLPLTWRHFRTALWLVPLAILYGVTIEALQPLIGRSASGLDIVANTLGAVLGCLPGAVRAKLRPSQSAKPYDP